MVTALVYLCLIVIGLSLLMMVGFGLKNAGSTLTNSKLGLAAFALPVLIFGVLFAVNQGAEYGAFLTAGVLTAAIMTVLGLIALIAFGTKSLFT
jgi:hypothetical protein